MGAAKVPAYDSDGRLRLPRSDDTIVFTIHGSPDDPARKSAYLGPTELPWLRRQQLANPSRAEL